MNCLFADKATLMIVMGKAHLWAPVLIAALFVYLHRYAQWEFPGPKHMFLMFGTVLTFYEAKDILFQVLRAHSDNASWAMVFAALALIWVGLDAMKSVLADLRPEEEDSEDTDGADVGDGRDQ